MSQQDDKALAAAAQSVLAASDAMADASRMLEEAHKRHTAAMARLMLLMMRPIKGKNPEMEEEVHQNGEDKPSKKRSFTRPEEDKIRRLVREGKTQREVAEVMGTRQSSISYIVNRRAKPAHKIPSTVSGLIVAALRQSETALDRDGLLKSIMDQHGEAPSPDSIRRTSNELIAKGTIARDGKYYKLLGE